VLLQFGLTQPGLAFVLIFIIINAIGLHFGQDEYKCQQSNKTLQFAASRRPFLN
jgi:hypothetical protein